MTRPIAPVAKKESRRIEQLGRVRSDDYAWMKDDNWQAVMRDPSVLRGDIREHLEAENAYRKAMLASTGDLQARIYEEMKGRMKEDEASAPLPDGPWDYFVRYELGAQHPRHVRRPRGGNGDASETGHVGIAFGPIIRADSAPGVFIRDPPFDVHRAFISRGGADPQSLGGPAAGSHGLRLAPDPCAR